MTRSTPGPAPGGRSRCWTLLVLLWLIGEGLAPSPALAQPRATPILIGALTEAWGPTPAIVGLRDGLVAMGHREDRDFVIGVRFTGGDAPTTPGTRSSSPSSTGIGRRRAAWV